MESEEALNLKLVVSTLRAQSRWFREPAALLAAQGLTPTQFGVLELLFHKGDLSVGQIIEKILVTGGNLTVVLRNLEKSGLIRRVQDAVDKRVYRICISEKGSTLMNDVFPAHVAALGRAFSVLSPTEKQTIIELMKKIGKQQ